VQINACATPAKPKGLTSGHRAMRFLKRLYLPLITLC
jgi:hypothetical protein